MSVSDNIFLLTALSEILKIPHSFLPSALHLARKTHKTEEKMKNMAYKT
jgi:hypothetical protein